MVGSLADGDAETFHNRQHEGHSGFVVNQMIGVSDYTLPKKPDVVLINCGTNDANPVDGQDIPNTAKRMVELLNHLFANIDGVTIILSTFLPRRDSSDSNVNIINPGYSDLVRQFDNAGKKIVLADFNDGFLDLDTDYYDGIHLNEKGAAKLAAVWDQAILEAENRQFLIEPIDTGKPDNSTSSDDDETCDVVCFFCSASLRRDCLVTVQDVLEEFILISRMRFDVAHEVTHAAEGLLHGRSQSVNTFPGCHLRKFQFLKPSKTCRSILSVAACCLLLRGGRPAADVALSFHDQRWSTPALF
ncbi:SGNH hydrolase-type esterase domain-containing protein [Truncatella angustata]|uniref:SGNH hydrolase-type esterase domain-containing protein n=1 Tax=Truncatella angustata TaxID=152316 RepID=A0A9P8ZVS3_9PEZI|nr:SGNH hydrolase-type esterase domain-containing protein [Truncatella angustata]KAH6652290.1 SGNH hydrolase-type esterase domain-containing protein [Truncatella angustata]